MNSKILVTGFRPFLQESVNPSELLLGELAAELSFIETLLLPVSYEKSMALLETHWQLHGPYSGLVMLGQAGGRKAVCLERAALNWCETSHADEDGDAPAAGPLKAEAPPAVIADFFPTHWRDVLNAIGPTEISFSAGTFVCNSLYFHALTKVCPAGTPAVFVHVPYLPEQTVSKPEQPSLPLEVQKKIVRRLLELIQDLPASALS